jgi:hypothetical protein
MMLALLCLGSPAFSRPIRMSVLFHYTHNRINELVDFIFIVLGISNHIFPIASRFSRMPLRWIVIVAVAVSYEAFSQAL